MDRRTFLGVAGAGALAALVGCSANTVGGDGSAGGAGLTGLPSIGGRSGGGQSAKDHFLLTGIDNQALALDPSNGNVLWKYALTESSNLSSADVAASGIYLIDDDGFLDRLNGKGVPQARVPLPDRAPMLVATAPLCLDGKLFIANWDGNVNVLDAVTLAPGSWHYGVPGADAFRTSPVGEGETVYLSLPTPNNVVVAISAKDGAKQWSWSASGACGTPVIAGDALVLAVGANYLVSLDRETGRLRWTASGGSFSQPSVDGGDIYCQRDEYMCRLDLASGKLRWAVKVLQEVVSGPSASPRLDGDVLVGYVENFAYALTPVGDYSGFSLMPVGFDAASGRQLWQRKDLQLNDSSVSVSAGRAYPSVAASLGGKVQESVTCLDTASGKTIWLNGMQTNFSPFLATVPSG